MWCGAEWGSASAGEDLDVSRSQEVTTRDEMDIGVAMSGLRRTALDWPSPGFAIARFCTLPTATHQVADRRNCG